MTSPDRCPSAEALSQFLAGRLPEAAVARVEHHLAECNRCGEQLGGLLQRDELARALPQAGRVALEARDDNFLAGLMHRLHALGGADIPTSSQGAALTLPSGDTPSEDEEAIRSLLQPPQLDDELGRLGGYRVLKVLGRGGMGVVFRAEDPQLQRAVAPKAMLPRLAALPSARERFLREARAAAALKHDHIVSIYQVGEDCGVPFLAMEFLEGESLEDRLKREPQPSLAEVLRIGREIAEGMAAAHDHGVIHRDIKPGNVWLEGKRGRVKILDFGLARSVTEKAHLTHSGLILGTPEYMAPEQASGKVPVDHRCDLFSLGCVVYQMCTGSKPFQGQDVMAVLASVALDTPESPRVKNPAVPIVLSELIDSLLTKDVDRRIPATAGEVVAALGAIEAGSTSAEKKPTSLPPSPPRRWIGLWLMPLAGVAILVLVVGGRMLLVGHLVDSSPKSHSLPQTSPALLRLRILKIDVHHFARIGKDEADHRGLIGERSFATHLNDQVTVEAQLSRPAYAYLIAFRPDGEFDLCYPDSEEARPTLTERPLYPPPEKRQVRYGLSDGAGLMVFAVVASVQPLPAFRAWPGQTQLKWGRFEGTPGQVWWDDGQLLDTLTPSGAVRGDRGKDEAALGRSGVVVRLTDSLKTGPRIDAAATIGFAVRQP